MPPMMVFPSSGQGLQLPAQSGLSAYQDVFDFDQSKGVSQLWKNTDHRGMGFLDEFLSLDDCETESFDLLDWAPDDLPLHSLAEDHISFALRCKTFQH
jgi:hypothetical protein